MAEQQQDRQAAVRQPGLDTKALSSFANTLAADENLAIFRRFDEYNLLNFLLLQDEVHKAAAEFRSLCPLEDVESAAEMTGPEYISSYIMGRRPVTLENASQQTVQQETERRAAWARLKEKMAPYSRSRDKTEGSLFAHVVSKLKVDKTVLCWS